MNIYFSFFAVALVLSQNVKADNFPPLTLSTETYYHLNDYDMLKKRIGDSDEEKLRYSLKGVLCCPAQTNEEREYNRRTNFSSTNFVKKILRKKSDIENDFMCENEPQPVIDRKSISADVYTTNYTEELKIYRSGYKICDIGKLLGDDLIDLVYENCDLLSRIDFLFDERNAGVKQVRYQISGPLADESVKECENFDLGKEIIDVEKMNYAFSQQNQNDVLKDMAWWTAGVVSKTIQSNVEASSTKRTYKVETCTTTQSERVMRNSLPEDERDYFIPQPLGSKLHFFGDYIQSTTCTYLNTAPMWKSVSEDAWNRVEKFVRKVAWQIGKVEVISGTHGVFKYSTGDAKNCKLEQLEYLYNGQIPIPEIFWTVIVHQHRTKVYIPSTISIGNTYAIFTFYGSKMQYNYYGMILVTWNKLVTRKPEEICDVVDCNDFGWGGIHKNVSTSLTFCCAFTKKNLEKLQMRMILVENYKNLNLNDVVIHIAPFETDVNRNVARNIATEEEAMNSSIQPMEE